MSSYTFLIKTFGCKVNQYEGQLLREQLLSLGFIEKESLPVDIYIVNGCAVTHRSYKKAGKALKTGANGQCGLKVLTGCSASAFKDRPMPWGFDLLVEQKNKSNLASIISGRFGINKAQNMAPSVISFLKSHHRAFVKVQDGCDVMCSYCYIPYLRGNEIRVRPLEEVKRELISLRKTGYNEVVFTGISLGRAKYLPELLDIGREIGFARLRLSSIEAKDIDKRLVDAIAENPSVCKHLHIPVQSASDAVLKRMNRPYTSDMYREIIDMCKENISGLALSTDIMAGFPLETEDEFWETMQFLRYARPMRVHAFPYSVRPKTYAGMYYKNCQQVPGDVKKRRIKRLLKEASRWAVEYISPFVGKELDVLIERRHQNGFWGTSEFFFQVYVEQGIGLREGEIYKVKIYGIDKDRPVLLGSKI